MSALPGIQLLLFKILFRLLASHFSLLVQRKVTERKDTPLVPVSCAFQKTAVVPVRHPCRIVTKTNILFVFHQFSSNARGTRKGMK